jgi:hypothetical protein
MPPPDKMLRFNGAFPSISYSRMSAVSSAPVSLVFEEMGSRLYPILFFVLLVAATPAPPKKIKMGVLMTNMYYYTDRQHTKLRCPYTLDEPYWCPLYRVCCDTAAIGCCSSGCCMKGMGCSPEGYCVSKGCSSLGAPGSVC